MTALLSAWLLACGGGGSEPDRDEPQTDRHSTVAVASGATGAVDTAGAGTGLAVAAPVPFPNESPALAVSRDGRTLGVAWVRRDAQSYRQVWVALSSDGTTFSTPVLVSDADDDVQANWPGGPSLVVDDDRVLVSWVGSRRNAFTARVRAVARDGDRLVGPAEELTTIEMPPSYHSLTYPTLALHPDGHGVLAVVAAPAFEGRLWVARERYGWAVEDLTEGRAQEPPCECCPPSLLVRDDGELLVAWRGDFKKEIYLATASYDTPFSDGQPVTMSGVEGDVCPLDGPQVVDEDGSLTVWWSDTRSDAAQVWSSSEATGWQAEPVLDEAGAQWRVAVGGPAEARFVAWEEGLFRPFRYVRVGDVASSPMVSPGGPLYEVRATTFAGYGVAMGIDQEGTLWFVRMTP